MKGFCLKIKVLILSTIISSVFFVTIVSGAITFKDVPKVHWANTYINWISDKGYMVGDTSGQFLPNLAIDKFQASKVFARILGYKYNGATKAEEDFYQKVYEKNKKLLSLYDNNFETWANDSNREIAFLLEKEVLTVSDLDQFIVKHKDGREFKTYMTKEEVALFITRVIGKEEDALSIKYDFTYTDDSAIGEKFKPYVYYLHDKTIFVPDNNGNFNPKDSVTRAIFSTIIYKSFKLTNDFVDINEDVPLGVPNTNIDGDDSVVNIFSITGTIDVYYPTLDALQIISEDGKKSIYKMGAVNTIYIDEFIKTVSDLKSGMKITAVINNNEIVDLKTSSKISTQDEKVPVDNATNTNTNDNVNIDGKISSISKADKVVGIDTYHSDGTLNETVKYSVSSNCKIVRGDTPEIFDNIIIGGNVKVAVTSGEITSMQLDSKNIKGTGILKDKKINSFGIPILSVEIQNDGVYDLSVESNSVITKKGYGNTVWENIRIGDTVEVTSENNKIKDLYAYGKKSSVVGVVENVYMSTNYNTITIKNNEGKSETYRVVPGFKDINYIKIGTTIRANLDSLEIEAVTILVNSSPVKSLSFTGEIKSFSRNSIRLIDTVTKESKNINIVSGTVYIDSKAGKFVDSKSLKNGLIAYITLDEKNENVARTITFLS